MSDDLLHWKHKAVILKRHMESDRWDCIGGAATWMIKESDSLWAVPRLKKVDGKYWMVYHSYPGTGYESGPAEIGLAWTQDEELLDWLPGQTGFLLERRGGMEAGGLYKACIIQNDGLWYMFYNAKDKKGTMDGTERAWPGPRIWSIGPRCRENPVLRVNPDSWDERFVSDPCIVKDGDVWVNFYFGYGRMYEDGHTHAQEGLALSRDLFTWEKVKEPILTYGKPGAIDSGHAP